jgi:hypothetical protein
MNNLEFLKERQQYVIMKINVIMRLHPSKKYEIKFRNKKIKTAASVLQEVKSPYFITFIFSNYWIQKLVLYELENLIKHECAHAILNNEHGHGSKFAEVCKSLKCSKKWQARFTNQATVHPHNVKK